MNSRLQQAIRLGREDKEAEEHAKRKKQEAEWAKKKAWEEAKAADYRKLIGDGTQIYKVIRKAVAEGKTYLRAFNMADLGYEPAPNRYRIDPEPIYYPIVTVLRELGLEAKYERSVIRHPINGSIDDAWFDDEVLDTCLVDIIWEK